MFWVILDRDGVINEESPAYIRSADEWRPVPGSLAAIARLNRAGAKIVVVTNQSGVARGYFDVVTLQAIHDKMCQQLALLGGSLAKIYYCPHHPDDGCNCRKPKTGMFMQIATDFAVNWSNTYVVGDSWSDIEAALAMNAKAILVTTGKGQHTLTQHQHELNGVVVMKDLSAAADYILHQQLNGGEE